ncbi:MAG: 23S rRNA pseudouridine(955/2504/2580) synthase RluC [Betaproteobacteria bacterium]|nr:23S rRNA pseudouridine(955/2504/2580) synthase RluC [Betaproteobacteria bacterium]
MKQLSKESVNWLEVGAEEAGQRIDNYLIRWLKGVPKSHVYRIVRSGEVRVNKGRIGPQYRVQAGDRVRVPPIRVAPRPVLTSVKPVARLALALDILYEDAALLVINKPSGLAVHGGSGVSLGVIEHLRAARPQARFLELVHRLDRDTSGVLMLAKKRLALVTLHEQLREGRMHKVYLALVRGHWREAKRAVKAPLSKYVLASGERRVSVSDDGLAAHTIFRLQKSWPLHDPPLSLLEAELKTGRTHQIRVHLAHLGFPIVGDEKYGDFVFNKKIQLNQVLRRMFLHAREIAMVHPESGETLRLSAPLPQELTRCIAHLDHTHAEAV